METLVFKSNLSGLSEHLNQKGDLKEERKKVWDSLEKFDVTVKGMEQFGARTSNPLTTCISEVEQSDIYVGIIGMRYGSEEPNSGKSYSQLECRKQASHFEYPYSFAF